MINTGGTPQHGGTLTIDQAGSPIEVDSLDFLYNPDAPTEQVITQIYDQLVENLPGSINPQPGLARRWKVSRNGLTYTFYLRSARFSNGMPATSADVKYVLDQARGPKSFFKSSLYGVISKVATPNKSTVIVTLSKPTPGFIYFLANPAASIVPSALIKAKGFTWYKTHPIGTGPFVLTRWVKDQEVDLTRNKYYWRTGLPYLNGVRMRVIANDNTRVLDVQSGTVDASDIVPFSQIATINKGGSAKVLVAPGGDMFVIWMTCSQKPLDEQVVRQALAYATPVASIQKVVFAGVAPRMNGLIPKLKYWSPSVPPYPYDVAKAKALLAKSSVPNGFSATINIIGSDQADNQVAQIVQQAWSQIGVKLTIQRVDSAGLGTKWTKGASDFYLFQPGVFSTDVVVDDEFASLLFDSPQLNNFYTFLKDPAASALVAKATSELSEAARKRDFARVQAITMQDPPVIPLTYTPNRVAVRNNVHNFNYMMAGSYWRLDTVWKS